MTGKRLFLSHTMTHHSISFDFDEIQINQREINVSMPWKWWRFILMMTVSRNDHRSLEVMKSIPISEYIAIFCHEFKFVAQIICLRLKHLCNKKKRERERKTYSFVRCYSVPFDAAAFRRICEYILHTLRNHKQTCIKAFPSFKQALEEWPAKLRTNIIPAVASHRKVIICA